MKICKDDLIFSSCAGAGGGRGAHEEKRPIEGIK
jgi:hypothetical protein